MNQFAQTHVSYLHLRHNVSNIGDLNREYYLQMALRTSGTHNWLSFV